MFATREGYLLFKWTLIVMTCELWLYKLIKRNNKKIVKHLEIYDFTTLDLDILNVNTQYYKSIY